MTSKKDLYEKFVDDPIQDGQNQKKKQGEIELEANFKSGSKNPSLVSPFTATSPQNTNKEGLDLHRIPPDIEECENHRKAMLMGKPISKDSKNIDPMSGHFIDNEPFPICADPNDFSIMGLGYSMYFQFIKYCIILILVIFIISGLYNLYSNFTGSYCLPPTEDNLDSAKFDNTICIASYITIYTIANNLDLEQELIIQQILNIVTLVMMMFLIQLFKKIQKEHAMEFNTKAITPADYSFIVRNIPAHALKDTDLALEIKKFFSENGRNNGIINIKRINLCYDYTEKILLEKSLNSKIKENAKYIRLKNHKKPVDEGKMSKLKQEIKELEEKIKALEIAYLQGKSSKFSGTAIITCNSEEEKRAVLKKWQISKVKRLVESFKQASPYKWLGNMLHVSQAPEPSEIYWENLPISRGIKWRNRFLTFLITCILLVICFAVVLNFSLLQAEATDDIQQPDLEEMQNTYYYDETISTLSSVVIVIVNSLLGLTMVGLSNIEHYTTWTRYNSTLARKLGIVQFINTSFITFLVAYCNNDWWNKTGLIPNIFSVLRSNALIPMAVAILDANWVLRWWARRSIRKQGKDCILTQEQANIKFEEPTIDLSVKYAGISKTMFTTVFYASILPIGLIWGIIALGGFYWTEKYGFTRKSSKGRTVGSDLSIDMLDFMTLCLPIYALGNLFFSQIFYSQCDAAHKLALLGLLITIVHTFFPCELINHSWLRIPPDELLLKTYDEVKLAFDEDYDRCNPATKEEAIKEFIYVQQKSATSPMNK